MRRARLLILVGLGVASAILVVRLLWPFLPAIVTSAVLAALAFPAHERFARLLRQPSVAAFATTVIIFLIVLLPLVWLVMALPAQLGALGWIGREAAGTIGPGGYLWAWADRIGMQLGFPPGAFAATVDEQLSGFVQLGAGRMLAFLTGVGGWILQAGIAVFTLFYLLRDGRQVVDGIARLVPLEAGQTQALLGRTREVVFATVFGNVVIAIVQGTLGGLAFWIVGLPAPILWGVVMGVLSLLPIVGPVFVWAPAVVYLLLAGEMARAIALLIFGAVLVSTIDNLLRAIVVGNRAELHPLAVFFSVLGGIVMVGAAGIFVGPVLFVVALALLRMTTLALDGRAGAAEAGTPPSPDDATLSLPLTGQAGSTG